MRSTNTTSAPSLARPGPVAASVPAASDPARPRSLGGLMAASARLYAAHPGTYFWPILLVELPVLALAVVLLALLEPGPPALTLPWVTAFTIFTAADSTVTLLEGVIAFVLLGLVGVQVTRTFRGGPAPLPAAWRQVAPRLGALLGGSFLLLVTVGFLTVAGVFLSVVFSLVLTVVNADPTTGGLGGAIQRGLADPTQDLWLRLVLLAVVAGAAIFLIVRWSLMVPVVVLEDAPPVESLRRSARLVRGYFWRTLAALLLGMLPLTLLSNGTLLAEFFSLVPAGPDRTAVLAVARAAGLLLRLGLLPWTLVFLTLYYYDLRARHTDLGRPD